ncbi:unnamed protein product [Hermetia illucens]|uniref:FLYWCH-type domain-containing protein n=1 Tax=Hermetia illucens TaxID=343691 RepID=A0A7R8UNC9_HERIL|nr:unnamed protein product [Hermetia illucens]
MQLTISRCSEQAKKEKCNYFLMAIIIGVLRLVRKGIDRIDKDDAGKLSEFRNVAVFGFTQKHQKMLIIGKHNYVVDRKLKNSINWRCSKYRRMNCKARAATKENIL